MSSFANPNGTFFSESHGGPVTVLTPASGSTVQLSATTADVYIANTATLAALTLNLPPPAEGGTEIDIACQSAITALTVHDRFGNAIPGAPTAGTPGTAVTLRYVSRAVGWVRWR